MMSRALTAGNLPEEDSYHFCRVPESLLEEAAGRTWTKSVISWAIDGDLPSVARDVFRGAVTQALTEWSKFMPKTFEEGIRAADILIHVRLIDGPGRVLAESQLPVGDDRQLSQWYDTGDRYTVTRPIPQGMIGLVEVVLHEMGHVLGLEHAPQGSSDVMAPIYRSGLVTLQAGDIRRIQTLYGSPALPPPPPGPTAPPLVIKIDWDAKGVTIPGFRVIRE